MSTAPAHPSSGPPTGWLWAALAIGLAVVAVRQLHHPAPDVVSARSRPAPETPNPPPPAASNPIPSSQAALEAVSTITSLFDNASSSTQKDLWDLIRTLRNPTSQLEERRSAARQLARRDDALAVAFLSEAAQSGPAQLRALVAEALGTGSNPAARQWLDQLLEDPDPMVARAAVRGWALGSETETMQRLHEILGDPDREESVRSEAALALGGRPEPQATALLQQALREANEDSLRANLWDALGHRPVHESASFIRSYLRSPEPTPEQKIMALESLGHAPGDVGPLLVPALEDPDPEVREAAAWALSRNEGSRSAGPWLYQALQKEPDAGVRRRLYQVFEHLPGVEPDTLLELVQTEPSPEARLAGFKAVAHRLNESSSPEVTAWFDAQAVPFLQEAALTHDNPLHRMTAVTTLRRADSPAALQALRHIAAATEDPRLSEVARVP